MASTDFTKRMITIANLAATEGTVADIGCDHGLTGICLIESGKAEHVIAMDLRPEPLRRAKENAKSFGTSEKMEFRLSDGFEKLKEGESSTAIITGMGGRLIVKLLINSGSILRDGYRLILSPHTDIRYVREFLEKVYIDIYDEIYMEDEGIRYNIICAEASEKTVSSIEMLSDMNNSDMNNPGIKISNNAKDTADFILDDKDIACPDEYILHEAYLRYGFHLIEKKDRLLLSAIEEELAKKKKLLKQIRQSATSERIKELETDLIIAGKAADLLTGTETEDGIQ